MRFDKWLVTATLALLGLGCQPQTSCPEDGAACGGDPTGTWNVANFCRDPFFAAPTPPTFFRQPVEMARQPSPVTTSSDWCSSLVVGAAAVTSFSFPHDTLSVSGGQLTYAADNPQAVEGTYRAVIRTSGPGAIDLSPTCLARSGMSLSCDMVTAALVKFAAIAVADPGVPCTDSPGDRDLCQFYYSYENIACAAISDGGCRCSYDVSFAGTLQGRWIRSGGILTHSDMSKMLPSQADYCVDGGSGILSLWGHDQTSILNQSGVRTLKLNKTASPTMP